jgi:hypothetical protein
MGTVFKDPSKAGAIMGGAGGGIAATTALMGLSGGLLAPALMIGGAGLTAFGQIQEGKTAAAIGKYNQQVDEMQAKEIEAKTSFDQTRQAEAGARVMSSMEAGQAAADGGMNLLALAKQRSELELQNLMIGREGTIGAATARAEGAMAKWQGRQAKRQSYLRTGGTLLQGFGSIASAMPKTPSPTSLETTATRASSWLNEPVHF